MLAMQYAFGLPNDYDMTHVRRRVAQRGPVFDTLPGLIQKSFLCNDRQGTGGWASAINQYAVFYVWENAEVAQAFLASELFQAVCEAFGRPQVRLMTVLRFERKETSRPPGFAIHQTTALADTRPAVEGVEQEQAHGCGLLASPGLFSLVSALDPERWELVRFTLWHSPDLGMARNHGGHGYEVLHLSAPIR